MTRHTTTRDRGDGRYSHSQAKQVQYVYLGAAVLWILGCYILRTYRAPNAFGLVILSVPLFLYGLGYVNATKVSKHVEDHAASSNILTVAVVFVTVLFEISHRKKQHYSVYIMLTALVLLILSAADVWTSHRSLCIARHTKSAVRTAAITLLIFVIYVNVVERIPLRELPLMSAVNTTPMTTDKTS